MKIGVGEGGLVQPAKILLDQIRTVDKKRLGAKLGMLPPARVEEVNRAIRVSLAV